MSYMSNLAWLIQGIQESFFKHSSSWDRHLETRRNCISTDILVVVSTKTMQPPMRDNVTWSTCRDELSSIVTREDDWGTRQDLSNYSHHSRQIGSASFINLWITLYNRYYQAHLLRWSRHFSIDLRAPPWTLAWCDVHASTRLSVEPKPNPLQSVYKPRDRLQMAECFLKDCSLRARWKAL